MSNASLKCQRKVPCYAYGINPNVDAFEDWWHMKRESFGPDDGVDFLDEAMFSAHISKSILDNTSDFDLLIDISSEKNEAVASFQNKQMI